MPTSTSRGRYNWACPAALILGKPPFDVVAGFEDVTVGVLGFIVDCVTGAGTVVVVGRGTGVGVGVTGAGTGVVVGVGIIGAGTVDGGGSVGVGDRTIEVGLPTGPVQICPMRQHPMMPLLARKQYLVGSQQLPSIQQFHAEGQQPVD